MNGRVVHFEVPYDDADRARAFYRDVFGWQIQPIPEMGYNMVATGPAGADGMPSEPGFIGGGMGQREEPMSAPVITINVDDMEATLATIEAKGGARLATMQVGDMGFAGYFRDCEGNLMGLWQSAQGG